MNDFLENTEDEVREYHPRYKLLYAVIVLAAAVLLARLWYLQIIEGNELRQYSEKNRIKETRVPAPRGLILDRENRVLVDNLPGFEVSISPQYATRLKKTAKAVGGVLGIPGPQIVTEVKRHRFRDGPFRPVRIKDNISLDDVFRLKMLRWDNPGLNVNESILRSYPLKDDGAQLFGYVAEISKSQIPKLNAKYKGQYDLQPGDLIGKDGLEQIWDYQLRGKDGVSYVEVDAKGRETPTESPIYFGFQSQPAQPGNNLVLTIDKDMQVATYKAMNRHDFLGPRVGGAVLMKSDGEILAWVSNPAFDPNQFSTGMSPQTWSTLINNPFKPLRNKVIQDSYPPGSSFKPYVALAALQEKVITPSSLISAPGFIKFGRRVYHDDSRTGYGKIAVDEAIERSSNVFFFKMGIALGIDRIAEYAKLFGLGSKTNIHLSHESSGLIPTTQWKLKALGEEWQPGENLSNAIGQGFVLVTALQMAVGYNAIALDGAVMKPFLVKKIIDQNNKVVREFHPEMIRDVSQPNSDGLYIDKKNFAVVQKGMDLVVNGPHGTARGAKLSYVHFAGKTGTSQVRSFSADQIYKSCYDRPWLQRHHGWFAAFAPYKHPEVAVAVIAQHTCSGARGAAIVVHDILDAYFHKYHPEMFEKDKKDHGKMTVIAPSQKKEAYE